MKRLHVCMPNGQCHEIPLKTPSGIEAELSLIKSAVMLAVKEGKAVIIGVRNGEEKHPRLTYEQSMILE